MKLDGEEISKAARQTTNLFFENENDVLEFASDCQALLTENFTNSVTEMDGEEECNYARRYILFQISTK